ncbi:CheR family methyltransferase [Fervidobacterium gondwanense]|uniref:CheR family methyltransferase n=1 Tax=Fervidobacterium gondwanense TaxID=44754 RepID=UPI003C7561A6
MDIQKGELQIINELKSKAEIILKKHNLKVEQRLIDRFLRNIKDISDILNDELLESLVIENLTIGESYFFRDIQTFEKLKCIFKEKSFWNILSVGCSNGEEVYTIAIIAKECGVKYKITGIDVNLQRILQAEKGCYRFWSIRFLNEEQICKYFTQVGDHFCINEEYKENVYFVHCNINSPECNFEREHKFDIIFLRRVLIYFDRVDEVITKIVNMLKDRGYLVIGLGEYFPKLFEYFTPVFSDSGAILKKISAAEKEKVKSTYYLKKEKVSEHSRKPEKILDTTELVTKEKLGKILKADAKSLEIEENVRVIESFLNQKLYKDAYEKLKKEIAKNHTNFIFWKYKALAELQLGMTSEAEKSLQKAIFLNHADEEVWQLKYLLNTQKGK